MAAESSEHFCVGAGKRHVAAPGTGGALRNITGGDRSDAAHTQELRQREEQSQRAFGCEDERALRLCDAELLVPGPGAWRGVRIQHRNRPRPAAAAFGELAAHVSRGET